MVPWRATDDGLVTPEVLTWYERLVGSHRGQKARGHEDDELAILAHGGVGAEQQSEQGQILSVDPIPVGA